MGIAIELAERGYIPESIIRLGARRLCGDRVREITRVGGITQEIISQLSRGPLALDTRKANEQHYEVPDDFFGYCLGSMRKYSCAFFERKEQSLDDAERNMLHRTISNAKLSDGQRILELGCGWGSLTLLMAERFPNAEIWAVSNSKSQKAYIDRIAQERGIDHNLTVFTRDMNVFSPAGEFDRIVSVEMFEHMRNWKKLLRRISNWLAYDGKLFVHVFTHRAVPYLFEERDDDDWMSKHFFTGGIMPSRDLLPHFAKELFRVEHAEHFNGTHYMHTANAWLQNLKKCRTDALKTLHAVHGDMELARRQLKRWEMFYIGVAETFGYKNGEEWGVSHYRLENA